MKELFLDKSLVTNPNVMFVKSVVQRSRKKLEMKMTIKKAWNFILRMIPCISIENTRKSTETGH